MKIQPTLTHIRSFTYLSSPVGGEANGIPRNWRALSVRTPLIGPYVVLTTTPSSDSVVQWTTMPTQEITKIRTVHRIEAYMVSLSGACFTMTLDLICLRFALRSNPVDQGISRTFICIQILALRFLVDRIGFVCVISSVFVCDDSLRRPTVSIATTHYFF